MSAIIAATDPNKCDTPLLDWRIRMDIGYRSVSGHEKPKRIWTKSSVDVPTDCPLGTGMRNTDVDY